MNVENYEYNLQLLKDIIKEKDNKIANLEAQNSHLQFRVGKQIKASWGRIVIDPEESTLEYIERLEHAIENYKVGEKNRTEAINKLTQEIEQLKKENLTRTNISSQDYHIKIALFDEKEKLKKDAQIYLNEIEKLRKQIIEVINEKDIIQHEFNRLEQDKCHACLISYKHKVAGDACTVFINRTNSVLEKDPQEPNFRFLSKCPEPTESTEYKLLEEKHIRAVKKSNELGRLVSQLNNEIASLNDRLYSMNSRKSEYMNKYFYLKEQIKLIIEASGLQRMLQQNSQGASYGDIKLDPED